MAEIVVAVAGVIGLSSAIGLLEAGHQVRVASRDFTPHTTLDVAGAIWCPYKAYPSDRILPWAMRSVEKFDVLSRERESGVRWITLTELYQQPQIHTWWDETALEVVRPDLANIMCQKLQ